VNVNDAIGWILDGSHYGGSNGIEARVTQHVLISLFVLLVASAIAVPLGFAVGHTGRGNRTVVLLSSGVRSLPTLGLITIVALNLGIGLKAPFVALTVLAIPSILAGAYAGFEAIDRSTIDAARALGMSEWQVVQRVEIPLGFPLLLAGLRSASLQVIATTTLADYVGGGGLGRFIFLGLKINDYSQMLAGSILVVGLAIASEVGFASISAFINRVRIRPLQNRPLQNRPLQNRPLQNRPATTPTLNRGGYSIKNSQ
jgi:osmoprotectant transport system permease protein